MRTGIIFLSVIVLLQFCVDAANGYSLGEIDGVALVTGVHDGDTFYINRSFYNASAIRLADVDAPELGQLNSTEATNLLVSLVYRKTVYLDIDDNYIFGSHGDDRQRLICVVYVDYNLTHYLNVNKALVDSGLVNIDDYTDNEFDPYSWTLCVSRTDIVPELLTQSIVVLFLLATLLVVVLCKKKKGK